MTKALKPLTDVISFFVIWAVIFFKGRFLLFVQEQMQFFQNDWHYISENITEPGGFVWMLTEAIVQFYHIPWVGVTLISLVSLAAIVMLRRCLAYVTDDWKTAEPFALASVIPLVYSVVVCEDSFSMVSFAVVITACAALMCFRGRHVWVVAALMTPLLYFLCGAASIMLPLFFAASSLSRRRDSAGIITAFVPSVVYLAAGLLMVRVGLVGAVSDLFVQTYQMYDDPGQDFNAFAVLPWYISAGSAFILTLLNSVRQGACSRFCLPVGAVMLVGACMFLWFSPDKNYAQNVGYEVYNDWARLHYMFSTERYEDLLDIYETEAPANSVESNYVNLALYRTGRLSTDFFKYRPSWLHNSLRTPWIDMPFPFPFIWIWTCDQMGALAKGHQAAFEGNILAGPRGSAPMTMHLTESEIIRGNYAAADKFLSCLENTIFYRDWAESRRAFLNDKSVLADPHYSAKRACYYEESRTLYDMNDLWLMTEVMKNSPEHYSTFEYTCLMTLAAGELQTFVNFIFNMSEAGTIRVPLAPIFQDAMVMAFPNTKEIHQLYKIEPQRVKDYAEYVAAVSGKNSNKLSTNAVMSKNSTRVWHYLYLLSKNTGKRTNPSR